jgi:hypothetical protein
MPLRQAEISTHAWQRFVSRWDGERPACYRRALLAIITQAEEEDLGYGQVLRMMANNFTPARYFITSHWRFVTDEAVTVILTIERPYRRGTIKNPKKKKHRQKS